MRDLDIRRTLHATELARFHRDGHSRVVDELGIFRGDFRIDIAIVNGSLHGYEIKSERDTLSRLPAQMEAYGRVFDYVTIVAGATHLAAVKQMIPEWWGIMEANQQLGAPLTLSPVRAPERNPSPDAHAVAQLLWRDEAVSLLREMGMRGKQIPRMRRDVCRHLTEVYSFDVLAGRVRAMLKARGDWRRRSVEQPQLPQDEHHMM